MTGYCSKCGEQICDCVTPIGLSSRDTIALLYYYSNLYYDSVREQSELRKKTMRMRVFIEMLANGEISIGRGRAMAQEILDDHSEDKLAMVHTTSREK